jgi:hypothetical protein
VPVLAAMEMDAYEGLSDRAKTLPLVMTTKDKRKNRMEIDFFMGMSTLHMISEFTFQLRGLPFSNHPMARNT